MGKITLSDLRTRQAWSLNQKIDHTCYAVEAFVAYCKEHGRTPYVSFSGGLNSTVLLEIVRRFVDPDMPGVFCSTGNEYPEIVRFVRHTENVTIIRPTMTPREVVARYGFPLVSKEQAQNIYEVRHVKGEKTRRRRLEGVANCRSSAIPKKWRYLINEPYEVSHKCCEHLKKGPMRKFYRNSNALVMLGTMAGESNLRTGQYLTRGACNTFSDDPRKVYSAPLSIWTDTDCWDYIHRFNVPYCPIYDMPGITRTGCVFCGFGAHYGGGNRFRVLNNLHPKLYQMVMNYTNNGYTLRYALLRMGVQLPDEQPELFGNIG
jgi:PP-loop domain protein